MKRQYPSTYPKDIFCAHNIDSLNSKVCSAIMQYFCSGLANEKAWLQLKTDFAKREDVLDEIEKLCDFEEYNWIPDNASLNVYLFSDAIKEEKGEYAVRWEELNERSNPSYPYEGGIAKLFEVSNNPAFLYKKLANTDKLPQIIEDYVNGNALSSISELPNQVFCKSFIVAMLDDNHYKNL